jgi:hypothetical protein
LISGLWAELVGVESELHGVVVQTLALLIQGGDTFEWIMHGHFGQLTGFVTAN